MRYTRQGRDRADHDTRKPEHLAGVLVVGTAAAGLRQHLCVPGTLGQPVSEGRLPVAMEPLNWSTARAELAVVASQQWGERAHQHPNRGARGGSLESPSSRFAAQQSRGRRLQDLAAQEGCCVARHGGVELALRVPQLVEQVLDLEVRICLGLQATAGQGRPFENAHARGGSILQARLQGPPRAHNPRR